MRNLALLVTGLFLRGKVQLPFVVRKWHLPSKEPSLVNRLRRFLSNNRLSVQACYRPVAQQLVSVFAGHTIRLVIDCTKYVMVSWSGQSWVRLESLGLEEGETRIIGWARLTRKNNYGWVWLILHWEKSEKEPWYLVASCSGGRDLIKRYKQRISIFINITEIFTSLLRLIYNSHSSISSIF